MEEVEAARGARLLRALGRRLARTRLPDDDCRSSSTDSNSSRSRRSAGSTASVSPDPREEVSYSSSDTNSEDSPKRRRRPRSTTSSFRRVFQSLSISSRSHSCSSGNSDSDKPPRTNKKNSQPKKILRPPVTYTYVRGLSGLPTQRVPLGRNQHPSQRLVLTGINR